jgi:hypothetical protein
MAIAMKPTRAGLALECTECGFTTLNPDDLMFGHDCEVSE